MSLQPKSNSDLANERKNASFDVEKFAAWFYGGERKLRMKRTIDKELFKDMLYLFDYEYQSYDVKQTVDATTKLKNMKVKLNPGGSDLNPGLLMNMCFNNALIPANNPMAVQFLMFTKAIKEQGTPDIYEKFGKRADNFEIIGSYAQTELGHGKFLRGLETRADYDGAPDEFVLNTPTLNAYKWWPGRLGHVANYCIVVAQLYIDNQPKGEQLFILQLRDEETHIPLPGIDLIDIGKRTGLLGLKNVRIPRSNMLMRHAQVLRDGSFVQSSASQLAYFPMIFVRCNMVRCNAMTLLEAATIATHYSVVRRQMAISPNAPEFQILDHALQQKRLFSELAIGLAYRIAAEQIFQLYEETLSGIRADNLACLSELHALACVLQDSCFYDCTHGIASLRLACGHGHGYSDKLSTLDTAACTYENENTVMHLLVGRTLLKAWSNVQTGDQLMPTMTYMSRCADWQQFPAWTGSWGCLLQALQYTTTNKVRMTFENLNERLTEGQTQSEALNNTGVELAQIAELYGCTFMAETFMNEAVGPEALKRSNKINNVLSHLMELYLLRTIQRHMPNILMFISLSKRDVQALQACLACVLQALRPDALAICDGFGFPDRVLNSYDGNEYERIFKQAKRGPINQTPEHYLKPSTRSKL